MFGLFKRKSEKEKLIELYNKKKEKLYDAPFTVLNSNGVDGIFNDDETHELNINKFIIYEEILSKIKI